MEIAELGNLREFGIAWTNINHSIPKNIGEAKALGNTSEFFE
jgi:hypothetical protein